MQTLFSFLLKNAYKIDYFILNIDMEFTENTLHKIDHDF